MTEPFDFLGSYIAPAVIAFIVAFAFLLLREYKKYTSSTYYKITKVSFLSLWLDLGKIGEYTTYKHLQHLEKEGARFLFNIYVPKKDGETTEIDVLMLTQKGIFVFESKNYSGWIFGSEYQKNWYQTLPTGRGRGRSHKEAFFNPIMQNNLHIKHLKALIGEEYPVHSIIVFSERCTLKSINIKSESIKVIKRNNVSAVVSEILNKATHTLLDDATIKNIYDTLYPYTQVSDEEKAQHIANIKMKIAERHNEANSVITAKVPIEEAVLSPIEDEEDKKEAPAESEALSAENSIDNSESQAESDICPKCGGKLILKTASKGKNVGNQFWGCSNFPKCRYIKSKQ